MLRNQESRIQVSPRAEAFRQHGFILFHQFVSTETLTKLQTAVARLHSQSPAGIRDLLRRSPEVAEFARCRSVVTILEELISATPFAVRGILFDKSAEANWGVAWHQDLAVAVRERRDTIGFTGWSNKAGAPHVNAPAEILERMVTLRLHLDECNDGNGALRVIAGSHHRGKLNSNRIEEWQQRGPILSCETAAGGALVMRPLLLHASGPAAVPSRRRVIHLEFAAEDLPNGLEWFERI